MSEGVRYLSPDEVFANPENPRLNFREKEMAELEESIRTQNILVPLTVYTESSGRFVLLDGERRWRCAKRLGLTRVPAIVQPEPTRMANIMMMFAIHNARSDWDPLSTATKLKDLEAMYLENEKRAPTETQLAQLASLSRGEVRRLKNILALPELYLSKLRREARKPKVEQLITVDHMLEVTRGARALMSQGVLDDEERSRLELSLIEKFESRVLRSTVEPRLLTRIARGVKRGDLPLGVARHVSLALIDDANYKVTDAYAESAMNSDAELAIETTVSRLASKLDSEAADFKLSDSTRDALFALRVAIDQILKG